MARALLRYWRGDYEGSLHTVVPRIEAGAQRLVLALDEPAYQVARGSQPGKYVGLPSLLDVLAQHDFDPDWDRFLRTFLLGPAGLNGRHDLAHGFNLHRRPRVDAALALRALGLLVAMPFPAEPAKGPTLPPASPLLASSVTGSQPSHAFSGEVLGAPYFRWLWI